MSEIYGTKGNGTTVHIVTRHHDADGVHIASTAICGGFGQSEVAYIRAGRVREIYAAGTTCARCAAVTA
jgi:hypothetical protein